MQTFRIENVRGWFVVSAVGGRILGVHSTRAKAERQIYAIELKRNTPKAPRRGIA